MSFPEDSTHEQIYRPVDFLTTDFDYESLDEIPGEMIEAGARVIAGRLIRDIMAWIAESEDRQSAYLRSRLVWWMIDPKQRNVKLNALAVALGVKKQSLGRLHSQFRAKFRFVGPSAKSDAAVKAYKKMHKLRKLNNI